MKKQAIVDRLDRHLRGPGDELFWRTAAALVGALAAISVLMQVFRAPYLLQNDALQFTSWMAKWTEPALRHPDLLRDYWESVSPWFYTLVYRAAFLFGLDPILTTKLFPPVLLVLLPLACFRLARGLKAEPVVAFVLSVLVIDLAGKLTASGTPRSFWPIFLVLVVDGLVRRSIWQTVLVQGLLAGAYPQIALVSAGVIGLSAVLPGDGRWLDLSRRRIALILACAVATVAGLAPSMLATDGFGPVATLADARTIPTFAAGGRGPVFEEDGSVNFLCGQRLGFFGDRCHGIDDPELWLLMLMLVMAPAVLLYRSIRPSCHGADRPRARTPLVAFLVVFGVLGSFLAALFLFRLHLPSRYGEGPILFSALATALVGCEWIRSWPLPADLARRGWGRLLLAGTAVLMLVGSIATAVDVSALARRVERPEIIAAAARTLPSSRLAGFVAEFDEIPVHAKRSLLFSREHAIAYHLGYFHEVEARMNHLRRVVQTRDKEELRRLLAESRFDILFVERQTLEKGSLPGRFTGFFSPADLNANRGTEAAPALASIALECRTALIAEVSVLDANCLRRRIDEDPVTRPGLEPPKIK
jgi:hypothetical protein